MKNNLLALAGAVGGGVLGYFAFAWLIRQGLYALVLPGGLVGMGAGIFKSRSLPVHVACGVLALGLGVFTEWRFAPFIGDVSLAYFVGHLQQLQPFTLIMIAVGGVLGFWVPFRRRLDGGRAG